MQRTLFALSLGFAGVILATHAGWSGPGPLSPDRLPRGKIACAQAQPTAPFAPSQISFSEIASSAHVTN
jgi:hypothetical protein